MTARILLFLLSTLLISQEARADKEVCIESTNALYQAFAEVSSSDTGTVTFKLRSGNYTLGSDLSLWYRSPDGDPNRSHGKLSISGGWGPGCTAQSMSLGATTLLAASGTPTMSIEANANSVDLSNISSQNVKFSFDNWVCYVQHFEEGNTITIRQSRLENTRVGFGSRCHNHAIRNSLITSRTDNPDDVAIAYGPSWGDDTPAQSFTVVGSTVRGGALRINIIPFGNLNPTQAIVKLQNSVFENDGAEVSIDGGDLFAIRNRYDSLNVVNGSIAQNVSNINADPQLQASGLPSNSSPLVNAGSRFVDGGLPTLDLAANPRNVGTNPDLGAFETSVNNVAVLQVTNTAASGVGSLAAAIASANAFNGTQSIEFDIPGACPRVITLSSTLQITDALRIKGATQPGTVLNSLGFGGYNGAPCIVLNAGSGVSDAINFNSSEAGDDLDVLNVGFSGFSSSGVSLRSGAGHRLAGLHFGATIGTLALDDVTFPIRVLDNASNVEIGGTDLGSVNFIGSASIAIQLFGPGSNLVQRNAIGSRGLDNFGNIVGINVSSPSNVFDSNRIGLSSAPNVLMTNPNARLNIFTNNSIYGSDSDGLSIGNGAAINRIGPDNSFTSNAGNGVLVASGARNQIRENRFGGNGELGIDLGGDGVTPNDDDPVSGIVTGLANRLQNYPLLDSVRRSVLSPTSTYVTLDGSLRTTPGSYAVDVFRVPSCDPSGYGEGNSIIGSFTVDVQCDFLVNQQCTEPFNVLLPENDFSETDAISLTATSQLAGGASGNTSEFSRCYQQNPDFSITVSNGVSSVTPGTTTTYTIMARNAGFTPTGAERVRDTFPAACSSVAWTCVGASGGSCPASGTGNIDTTAINLPVGARVTFTAQCAISPSASGDLVNTATISSSRTDLTPTNNTATDSDPIISTVLSISPASVVEGSGGSNSLIYTVTATPTPQALVEVNYASGNGSASAGSDYTAVNGTLSFASGVASRVIRVVVATDRVVEANETLNMTLSQPSANARIGVASAIGTINNDDSAVLSINDAAVVEGNSGTTAITFSATLSNPVQGIVSARVNTANGNNLDPARNATLANNDYQAVVDGNVSFGSGLTLRTTSVQVVGDTTPEASEFLRLLLSNLSVPASIPAGAVTLGDITGIGTISNDDGEATTTTITSSTPNPSLVGQLYTVRVTVRGQAQAPVGTVSVSDGDASCIFELTAAIVPNASGVCSLASQSSGLKTLTATYSPSSSAFASSSGTVTQQVNDGQPTTTSIASTAPNPSLVNQPYTVTVSVVGTSLSPTGSVTVSDGEVDCTLSLSAGSAPNASGSCVLTSVTPGLKTLSASYTPSGFAFAASSGTATQQVNDDDLIFEDSFE